MKSIKLGCDVCVYGNVDKTIEYAVMAEKCGFDAVSIPDHTFHPLSFHRHAPSAGHPWEAFTLLSAIAVRTNRVTVMPVVTEPVRRHPALIAHTISTLDHISKGRAALGIGTGEAFNISPLVDITWGKPFTRLKEAVMLIKELFSSTIEKPVTFSGEHFKVKDAFLGFKPLQRPHPPIYIGGWGPKVRRLVGQIADGWIPWIYSPEAYRKDLREIERGAKETGRSMDEIDCGLNVRAIILEDENEARRIAIPPSRRALALRGQLLRDLGYPNLAKEALEVWSALHTEDETEKMIQLSSRIPEKIVEKTVIAGNPDEAIGQIESFVKAGVTFIDFTLFIQRFEESLKAFRKKILPYFAEGGGK